MSAPITSQAAHPSKTASASKSSRAARTCVLHLCPDLESSDTARSIVDLAILTQRAGWRTLIASQGGMFVPEAERAAVRHTKMPLGKHGFFTNWRNRMQLESLIQRERPSILHVHGIDVLSNVLGVARTHRLPLVIDITRPILEPSRAQRLFKHLTDIPVLIRVPSDFMAMQLRELLKLEPEQIAIIPPGIDLRIYDAAAISPERLQSLSRLWRLPEHATVILMPMPMMQGSGHEQFLSALAQIKRDDIYAVLVGDDRRAPGMRTTVEDLISRHNLGGKVIMPEYCQDWPSGCWLASIIVAPNVTPRGQAVKLLGAQAIGRPVIVTDCGANPEMVMNGETAWVIPPDNVKALAETLREAIDLQSVQRVDLAERTRKFIADAFPQSAWLNSMMDLYEALLAPVVRTTKKAA
ncbi:MAG TPA: glycosyltransferase [Alphaproteobacteria bacterium]|nr:glycosyltransferase [Alphaproteobacteria bacterium]